MKEFKLEDSMPVEAILQNVWSLFDIIRNEAIGSEEYHFVLFLLSLYKDDILLHESFSEKNDESRSLIASIEKSNNTNSKQYLKLYKSFEPTIKSLSEKGIGSLTHMINKLDKKLLSENFPYIFDSVLYRISKSQGRFGAEFIQPVELTRFICSLANLPKKSKVFNPFAGLASFGVFLDQEQFYYGQEYNIKTWALGALRIMAYERPGITRYVSEDSILNWPKTSEKFDLIVANPPYGLRIGQQYRTAEPNMRTVEQFLITKGINSLSKKGKLIALLPHGFLFRGTKEKLLREDLISKDLIDTIISLPGGLLQNTSIPLVILIIDKNKKNLGKVRFIDAQKFVESKNSKEKILNDYALNGIVHGNNPDSDVVKVIDNSKIKEFDYNLNVPRYFQKQIEGVKLKDILEIVRGNRGGFPQNGKVVRIKDLKDDKVDFKLDLTGVLKTELSRPGLRQIDESCLLVSSYGKTLKPSLFKFSKTPIFIDSFVLSFKVNEQIADKAYLINELQADYVKEQLESYRFGSRIPKIRRDDLLEVVIKLPSLEEQRAKVQGIYELSERIRLLQKERNDIAHGKAANQFNEFASLKHTLGRPRQNILDWTDNLLHFLTAKREGFDKLNDAFVSFYETDMISALKEIKRDVNFMTEVLEKGENGFVIEEFGKTIISLSEVNKTITQLSSNGFNFKIKKLLLKGDKLKERGFLGNTVLFKTLIDNLLTNAHKYGFENRDSENEVVFELTEVDDSLSIEVRNNGNSFPKNFDREKFVTKYSTADAIAGSGLGGYDIHRIATEFENPEWELILDNDPIYPVIFKFLLPIKLNN